MMANPHGKNAQIFRAATVDIGHKDQLESKRKSLKSSRAKTIAMLWKL